MMLLHAARIPLGCAPFLTLLPLYRPFSPFSCHSVALFPPLRYNEAEVMIMQEIDRQKFGAFVATLRKEKGLTQKQLAERLFLSDKAVSKWETGVSLPDTALLIPLSELLGVSVAELLLGERAQTDTIHADQAVKAALSLSDAAQTRFLRHRSARGLAFLLCCAVGLVEMLLLYIGGQIRESIVTCFLLCVFFGVYFCFLARERLPVRYDEERLSAVSDGLLRMNLPGVRLSNSNWPMIVLTGCCWACASLVALPALALLMTALCPAFFAACGDYLLLALLLAGLFLPLYIVGKKFG